MIFLDETEHHKYYYFYNKNQNYFLKNSYRIIEMENNTYVENKIYFFIKLKLIFL